MRREVARAAVTAAWIALAVMAVPLAVAVYLLVLGNERGELQRVALRAATQVDASFPAGDPAELPAPEPGGQLGLYDRSGLLRAGTGAVQADALTTRALAGSIAQGVDGAMLVVAVPVASSERVTAAVRATSPAATVWRRTALAWTALAALMAAALLAAIAVARRRAGRLAGPLEALAAASKAVGDGDFTAQVPPCGIAEIDRVADTQNTTAGRLGDLLERERQFTANASHQLRTPLAGLQIVLEAAQSGGRPDLAGALDEALRTTRRLQATVEEVLALHRESAGPPERERSPEVPGHDRHAVEQILDAAASRWHGSFAAGGRQLSHGCDPETDDRTLPSARVGQILDVLLDNAMRHGHGHVQVTARAVGTATAIDVTDEGPGVPEDLGDVFGRGIGTAHGIGLSLARDFAVSLGGRLVLSARTPPVFTILLPGPPDDAAAADRAPDLPDPAHI
jgi:signal transduction histidine kinase